MNKKCIFLPLLVCALSAAGLHAGSTDGQSFSASTLSDATKEDIGDIRPESSAGMLSHLRVNASIRTDYTSNAKLAGDNSSSDFLALPSLEIGYKQPLGHGLSLDLAARQDTVAYAENSDMGFWGFDGTATLEYQYKPFWPQIYVQAEPYKYWNFDSGGSVAAAIGLTGGITHDVVFNKGRSIVFGGYGFSYYFASPTVDTRMTNRITIGITHQFRPAIFGQLFYSYQYTVYENRDRDDSRNIVGLNFTYQFSRNFFATLSTSFVDNISTFDTATYQSLNAGLGFTYQY